MKKTVLVAMLMGGVITFCGIWVGMQVCNAYWPSECRFDHAQNDTVRADAIVIGRVVQFTQVVEQQHDMVGYTATLRIGRVLRGRLREGAKVHIGVGGRGAEDGVTPTFLAIGTTHPGYDLAIDGVDMLYLDRVSDDETVPDDMRGSLWKPRSCHFSIHRFVKVEDGSVAVIAGAFPRRETRPVPVTEFLQQRGLLWDFGDSH